MDIQMLIASMGTVPFIILIGAILFLMSILRSGWFSQRKDTHEFQNIATSIGIAATFLGILIGLWNFDVNNIEEAVPELLAGMKFAFLTSISGLVVALILKWRDIQQSAQDESDEPQNPEEENTAALQDILNELQTLNKNVNGEGDSSLVTQIMKMRTNIVDKQEELNKEFKNFAEEMTKSNIDALTEAIEKVMGDFNTTVNEKLGETFDHFRQAVENLNAWQEEYKNQIDFQTKNMQSMRDSLSEVSQRVNDMTDSYKQISQISQQFDELIEKLNAQLQGSISFATTMGELRESMEGAGDIIKDEITKMTKGAVEEMGIMKDQVRETTTRMTEEMERATRKTLDDLQNNMISLSEGVTENMGETMNKTLADFGSNLAAISSRLTEDYEGLHKFLSSKR